MAAETGLEEATVAFNQEVRAPTVCSAHLGAGKAAAADVRTRGVNHSARPPAFLTLKST